MPASFEALRAARTTAARSVETTRERPPPENAASERMKFAGQHERSNATAAISSLASVENTSEDLQRR
jgi:hypothetical protein